METEKKGGKFKRGIAIAVLVAMLGGAGYLVFSWHYFYWNAAERKDSDMTFLWQWVMYAKGMKQAYTADNYGGTTPEETFALFIDALKAGDIELATKYYVPEKQGEVLQNLVIAKEKNHIQKYIEYLEKGDHGIFSSKDEYYMLASDENKKVILSIRLVINPANQKWKIVE